MSDLAITEANVLPGTGAKVSSGFAGGTVTRGDAVTLDADGLVIRATNDFIQVPLKDDVKGIALNDASTGQPIDYQTEGQITIGGTMVVGETYFLSADSGKIMPLGDVVELDSLVVKIGMAISATVMALKIYRSGAGVH